MTLFPVFPTSSFRHYLHHSSNLIRSNLTSVYVQGVFEALWNLPSKMFHIPPPFPPKITEIIQEKTKKDQVVQKRSGNSRNPILVPPPVRSELEEVSLLECTGRESRSLNIYLFTFFTSLFYFCQQFFRTYQKVWE